MPAGALSTDLTTLLQQFLTVIRTGATTGFLQDLQTGFLGNTTAIANLQIRGGVGNSLRVDPGTAGAPAVAVGEATSGTYWVTTNNLGESINGTLVFDWNATRIKSAQPVQLPDGTVAAPSLTYSGQSGAGFLRSAASVIGVALPAYSTSSAALAFNGSVGMVIGNALGLGFTSGSGATGTTDTVLIRGGAAQQIVFGGLSAAAGAATTQTAFIKNYSSIADNVATATMTITVPNAAHSASWRVTIAGSLGAGGAIGANEATGTNSYDVAIARTAGVNAVGTISTAYGTGNASVAGAATITCTAALSSVSGAVGATNTFTLNVTIAHGTGSSTNHTAVVYASVINANTAGVTLS